MTTLPEFEDDILQERTAAAAQERVAAYDAAFAWHGRDLEPWTIGREQLYLKLRAADAALPLHLALQHPESFLGDAVKVLYLCAHQPAEWRHLRADVPAFLEAVEAWAGSAILRDEQSDAIETALRILNAASSTRAVPRPGEKGGDDLGN